MGAPKGNKNALGGKGGGDISPYQNKFAEVAKQLCEAGATESEIADFFKVSARTIRNWKVRHVEFRAAIKVGKDAADDRVEYSMYNQAVGYDHDIEDVRIVGEKVLRYTVRQHIPPSFNAATFWLKNRRPDRWRDQRDLNMQAKVVNIDMSLSELKAATEQKLRELGVEITLPQIDNDTYGDE